MKCSNCGKDFEGNFCSNCGTRVEVSAMEQQPTLTREQKPPKKKKPFYFRWWFILIAIIAVFVVITTVGGNGEKIVWDEMVLGEFLPEPPTKRGEIIDNSSEGLSVDVNKVSDKQYADYIEECKEKGFNVDVESDSSSFGAYNKEGYKLTLSHYGDGKELSIDLEKPMEMGTIEWPASTAGKQLPKPNSTIGKISYEHDDNFSIYIGNTTKADYDKYVDECSKKGFNVDYDKGEDYYYATNKEGWDVSLNFEGNNTMRIDIDAPEEKVTSKTETTTSSKESKPAKTSEKKTTESVSSDFKEAMDSYEEFMDEYVAFMKKYKENPSDLTILADYSDYMSKYSKFIKDFEKWESEDMTTEEAAYYIEVQARVNKKLLEVAN